MATRWAVGAGKVILAAAVAGGLLLVALDLCDGAGIAGRAQFGGGRRAWGCGGGRGRGR